MFANKLKTYERVSRTRWFWSSHEYELSNEMKVDTCLLTKWTEQTEIDPRENSHIRIYQIAHVKFEAHHFTVHTSKIQTRKYLVYIWFRISSSSTTATSFPFPLLMLIVDSYAYIKFHPSIDKPGHLARKGKLGLMEGIRECKHLTAHWDFTWHQSLCDRKKTPLQREKWRKKNQTYSCIVLCASLPFGISDYVHIHWFKFTWENAFAILRCSTQCMVMRINSIYTSRHLHANKSHNLRLMWKRNLKRMGIKL